MLNQNIAVALAVTLVGLSGMTPALAQNKVFDLSASQSANMSGGGSGGSLSRGDIRKGGGDPFNNGAAPQAPAEQAFDPGSLAVQTMAPPAAPPSNNFGLGAQQDGQGQFQGMPGQGQFGGMPQQPQTAMIQQQQQPQRPPVDPNDPDSAPEMQLQWDAWHKRVAENIYFKYSQMADAAFAHSRPLACSAAYVVTRNGQIVNVRLLQKSPNMIYNALVMTAIQSLNGRMDILQFPAGSRRMEVDKSATFTQNYGSNVGFKYQINDHETIRQPQQQMPMQQRRR